jgi:hypothetical protein
MRAHPLDQLAAVGGDGAARLGGGRAVAIGLDRDPWKKLRGIGVEPEANLAAARVAARRQPVGELRYLSRL